MTTSTSRRSTGFTLVEVLVVLALAGLLGAAVLLTLPGDDRGFTREADRLGARLVRARQEAVLAARTMEVAVDARGHWVARQARGGWTTLDAAPFEPVAWEPGTGPDPADLAVRFRFDPTGTAEPARLVLARGPLRIVVEVDAHGEVDIDAPTS